MTQTNNSQDQPAQIAGQTYDYIYIESWKATLAQCEQQLEPGDYDRALQVGSADDFRKELDALKAEYPDPASTNVIMLLYPTLDHYDQFARSFVLMMSNKVEVSMLWGLLFLVVKLSLEARGTIDRITDMLDKIGHKLRRLNQCARIMPSGYSEMVGDASEIQREMIMLWLSVIGLFRNQNFDTDIKNVVRDLTSLYEKAMQNIGDAVGRVEKLAELAERQTRLIDLERFRHLFEEKEGSVKKAQLPCSSLPVAENKRFFHRQDVLDKIENLLRPGTRVSGIRSAAIWGLGGVGKTQTALAYAYSKKDMIDAVFWVPAETRLSIQQAFSNIAVNTLKLPGASSSATTENAILTQNWLSQTEANWLIIFDNVEDHQILADAWPVADHGAILITTRSPNIASQPIDSGIELTEFPDIEGAEFLQHLLPDRKSNADEDKAALAISTLLNGHALAINQMAAYINSRRMKLQTFLELYKKHSTKLHKERKPGWKYVGYNYALDTVWDLSFKSLDARASSFMSVLAFMSPDAIPLSIFEEQHDSHLKPPFDFCEDELVLWDTIDQLVATALVRLETDSNTLSMHRLVKAETLFRITTSERQGAFNAAIRLLFVKFPPRGLLAPRVDLWERGVQYLPHISSLANDWHDSQLRVEPLDSTTELCELMANVAFFVEQNDPANILSLTVDVAGEAYKKLPESLKDLNLWAGILELIAFRDLRDCDYSSCEQLGKESHELRTKLGQAGTIGIINSLDVWFLALDSAGRHDEARPLLEEAVRIEQDDDREEVRRLLARDNLNFTRNRYCAGDIPEAKKRISICAALFKDIGVGWDAEAALHMAYSSLYRHSEELDLAKQAIDLANAAFERGGITATSSWMAVDCACKGAQVAIAQGRASDAVNEAQKAITIGRLSKIDTGTLALSFHLLARAYGLDPSNKNKAEEARRSAQQLREILPPGRTDLTDESDRAYEFLVNIIQR